jgi:hypothetical protein
MRRKNLQSSESKQVREILMQSPNLSGCASGRARDYIRQRLIFKMGPKQLLQFRVPNSNSAFRPVSPQAARSILGAMTTGV